MHILFFSHFLLLLFFQAFAGVKSTYGTMSKTMKIKQPIRIITEECLGLEPLCSEVFMVTIMTVLIFFCTHTHKLNGDYLLYVSLRIHSLTIFLLMKFRIFLKNTL